MNTQDHMNGPRDSLREFARTGSQNAFARVVEAELDLVYQAAYRQVRDAHLAQDVAQAVFIVLAKKARAISGNVTLEGWLIKTTRFVAADALRQIQRQKLRERRAAEMRPTEVSDEALRDAEHVSGHLDAALARLAASDRDALVLRFLRGRTFGEVGTAMGISEDAAKKRVTRGLTKLRRLFMGKGVMLSVGAVGAALAAVPALAVPALPATGMVAGQAIAAMGGGSVGLSMVLAKGAMKTMLWSQWKLTSAVAAAVVVTGVLGGAVAQMAAGQGAGGGGGNVGRGPTAPPMPRGATRPAAPPPADPSEDAKTAVVAKFDNGMSLMFVAMGTGQQATRGGPWWSPEGTMRPAPELPNFSAQVVGGGGSTGGGGAAIGGFTGVARVLDGSETVADLYFRASGQRWMHGTGSAPPPSPVRTYVTFNFQAFSRPQDERPTTDIHFEVAAGPWTFYHVRELGNTNIKDPDGVGASGFYPAGAARTLAVDTFDKIVGTVQRRVYVEMKEEIAPIAGRAVLGTTPPEGVGGPIKTGGSFSGLVEENVAGVWLGVRTYSLLADFRNVSLHASGKSKVEVDATLAGDLPMREVVMHEFIEPIRRGEGVKVGKPLALVLNGLDKQFDMKAARVGEAWVDEARACAVVERVKRLEDKAEVKLAVAMKRQAGTWVLSDLNPKPEDLERYVGEFKKSAGKSPPPVAAENPEGQPATAAPAAIK